MTQAAIGYLRRQYLCVLRRCTAQNMVMVVGAGLAGGAAMAQGITPDGRTQTQLAVNGSVTDITTQTVRGANAFNSFSTFNVNAGSTVNLHLPGQTTNLLNLVHGERSYINGLLNAYQSGQLGGNVFFFNPHGVIVGQQGVMNVGSLTISTPSTDFMNRLISPQGVVDAAATSMALAGQVPLSATGLIRVQGRINALQAVTLAAGEIDVTAGAQVRAGGEARVAFQNLVNIAQVPMAAGVRLDGGVVRLFAAGDITVAGEVSANGSGADAHGGRVEIMADRTATLQSGAMVSANAGSSGDGGFVDFSARQHVVLAGGSLQARATLGTAGSVLIDPANITISADLLRSTAGNSSGGGISWDAGSLTLQADEQINVADNVLISTRSVAGGTRNDHINGASTGASGNLTLKAAHIDLGEGSMLLAQGGNGHEGGDVRVLATDINAVGASRTAEASIRAKKAVIRGRDVTLRANADTSLIVTLLETAPGTTLADAQSYLNSELDDLSDGPGGEQLAVKTKATATTALLGTTVQGTGAVVIEAKAGARAGFEKEATATVTVGDFVPSTGPMVASHISGQTVSILAKSDTSLTYNVLGTALTLADQSWLPDPDSGLVQLVNDLQFDFNEIPLVALSDSHASVNIGGASEVRAVDTLTIKAEAIAVAKPTFASPLLFSAAWGEADTSARVLVDGTSLLLAGGAAAVKASSDVELNVSATVTSTNKPIDATFARGQTNTDTSVTVGDNTRVDAGSLEVAANTSTDITVLANSANSGGSGVGLAVAVNESTSSTVATLGGDVITRSGNVDVTATTDVTGNGTSASASTLGDPSGIANKIANLQAGAQRGITSALLTATGKVSASQAEALGDFMFPGIKEGKFNASGAVAYTDSDNTASASIAAQASVRSAAGVGVTASITERPSASATAASTSTGNAIGGSAVIANFGNHANATIGSAAQVDAAGAIRVDAQTRVPYPWQIQWSSPLDILAYLQRDALDMVLTSYTLNSAKGKDGVGIAAGVSVLGFDNNASATIAQGAQINQRTNSTLTPGLNLSQQSVDVFARNEVNLVTAAGIASKKFFGATGGKGAIGGVASILDIGGTASAGIHDGASVRAEQSVKVDAESQHHLVAVTEAGGSANSVTVQGAVSLITMDTDTVAFIDDKAGIKAGQNVTVEAGSDLRTIAIAGGIAATKGPVGIGMSVSLNSIDNHVSALIGNVDPVADTAPATGTIAAGGDLAVQAKADTEIGAYSLAGAVATNSSQQTSAPASAGTTDSGSGSAAGGAGGGQGKFGIAMSGDASVNDITATTVATLSDGVRVTQANDVTVQADNTLAINALSGAVSISTQPQGNSIAGSYAQNTLSGTTAARLINATVDMSGDLSVQAGVDGSIQTLTASLAGAKGKVGVAGSVSINEIDNLTQVLLSNAHINGAGSVTLYSADISSIRSVAGALAYGGKAGVGLSFAWNKINNDTSTLVDTSDIEASGTVSVRAESDNAIDSISASIGASSGPMAGAGAVSINTINNTTAATVNGKLGVGIDAVGAVSVTADDSSRIFALAGGVGATTGQAGFGAAVAWSEVNNTVAAKATSGARLQSQAAGVQVKALSDTEVQAIAAAGGAADKVAVAGSFSAVQTHNTTLAEVSGGSVVEAAGAVLVGASDTSGIESLAGSVALSGQAALGVAVAYNVIDNDTQAKAAQSTLNGTSVAVEASTDADIASAAVGGGGAAKVAVTGSLGFNDITNRTAAAATGATLIASGDVSVVARDSSSIGSISGAAAVGGNGAVGAAGSYNHINGTVLAEVSGGSVTAGNTTVRARRSGELEVWAISGAGAGTAGFAGSIAINDVGGTNTARVDGGAVVQSSGNALVIAETDDVIKSRAGAVNVSGTVGGAGAVAFNDMHADTRAEVTGAGTRVTGAGNGAAAQVDNGLLGSASTLAARQQKDNLRGVAVVASSTSAVENYAISAAGGGSATVAATVSVALLGGSTTAELSDGAQLNSSLGNAAQEARVAAFHHDSITSGTGGGAIGGDAGLGGAVDTAVVSHTTTARVDNAQAQAQQALAVKAGSSSDITQAAVAVGGGTYAGLAGTGALILIDGATQALVDNARLDSRGTLAVQADAQTDIDLKAGALAISGAVGVGVTAAVTVSQQQTLARVSGTSELNANGAMDIAASTRFAQENYAYTAAAAGGVGVAGTLSVVVVKGSTDAELLGSARANADNSFGGAGQHVSVSAADSTSVDNKVGSLGIGLGGVGVGAVADVILVQNGASATVGAGTRITADGDVGVTASTTRTVDSISTAAAGGSTAGIAGAVSVISVGARPDGDARDNTTGSINKAGEMVTASATGDQLADDASGANGSAQRADAARSGVTLTQDFNATPASTSAAATVASGAVINAGRDVSVAATNRTDTDAIAVGAAVSGGLSLGGGIAIALVEDRTVASLAGTTTAGRHVSVTALDHQTSASVLRTYAGGAGLAGLAASFAWHEKDSTATAQLGGTVNALGNVTVDAGIAHELEANGGAAAVGIVGVGAAIAYVKENGQASAGVLSGASVTGASLDVHGHSTTTSRADVIAAAGGLVAGVGADADVSDTSRATATIADNSVVRAMGGAVQLRADVDPVARAESLGVAVSAGVSIGASLADTTVNTVAKANTGSGVDIQSGSLDVAATTRLRNGQRTAYSEATAGAGGLLLGASATDADAVVGSVTEASLGNNNDVTTSGATQVRANSTTSAAADVTGINIGLLAAGSNSALARTQTQTRATVGDSADIAAASLRVLADGNDHLRASTVAGAGGLGVLVASKAETDADATTLARLGASGGNTGVVTAGTVEVDAQQDVNFDATANSTSAAVVGYSGARASNTVDTNTQATVGAGMDINAGQFAARATNNILKPALSSGYNVDSGSGGLLNAAAARSSSVIQNHALVAAESGADIRVERAGLPQGSLIMAATNNVQAHDRTRLDSGGAVAIARAESDVRNDVNHASVRVGDGAELRSDGNIELSARTAANVNATTSSKTYGLAGAAEGNANATIGAQHEVVVGSNAFLEAEEDVHLMAGTDRTQANDLYANAETRLWNRTAIPIETDPQAHGQVVQTNSVVVAQNAQVRAVRNVHLIATEGRHRTRGFGEGTDLYLEALSAIGEFFGADTSSLKITGGSTYDNANLPFGLQAGLTPSSRVQVDGSVRAGVRHHQWLTLAADGLTVTSSEDMADKWQLRNNVNLATELSAEITALQQAAATVRAAANSYSGTDAADAALALDNDARILEQQLARLQAGAVVGFIDIANTTARTGNVNITGKVLTGGNSGSIVAPGDARIDIDNQSTRFMQTQALTIPDEDGGQITFNGLRVSSNNDINQRNAQGQMAQLGTLLDARTSPKPVIRVENTNSTDTASGSPAQLWMRGDVNNLGGEVKATSHGTLRVSANINAETVNLATGGDFIKTYTPGFTHQGGDPVARLGSLPDNRETAKVDYTQNGLPGCGGSGPGCSTTIAGNNVYISGERLNINGVIQAGLPDRAQLIDNSLLGASNPGQPGVTNSTAIASARAAWQANPGTAPRYIDLTNPAPDSSAVKVRYDAQNDRLELADVRMGGGHMELFGDVFSTGSGELRVMDGYGRINITNNTGYDIAVGRLDTGPGVEGMIRITDTSQRGVDNKPLVTEITRLGNTISSRSSATLDGDGKPTTVVSTAAGRNTTFNPKANRRFNWINGERTQVDEERIYTTKITLGFDWLGVDYDNPDTSTSSTSYQSRLTGDWLSTTGGSTDYALDYSTYTSGPVRWKDDTETRSRTDCAGEICVSENVRRTAYYRTITNEYYQHSLNASKPVAVTFTGFDTADLRVDAGSGQLLLSGLVRGLTGNTTLSAAKGIQSLSDEARIIASTLSLNSGSGAIGSAAAPVRIELTDADAITGLVKGRLTASGRDGVSVSATRGDLMIDSVTSTLGDVNLSADRSVQALGSGTSVTGQNVSLVSLTAGIGAVGTPLVVETLGGNTTLSARAAGDVHLQEATGDMRVRQIESVAGDVVLSVPAGRLLDGNSVEQVDEQTRTELLALWAEMSLTGTQAEQARQRNLSTQAQRLKQEYEAYFRLRDLRRQDNGTYTAAAYNPAFAYRSTAVQAAALKTANSWSDADVSAYEATQTAAYHAAYARFGGGNYVVGFAPALTATEIAALSDGAVWTEAQLANALAAGLFRPVSDTDIRIEQSNVIGNQVTLNALTGIGNEQAMPIVIALGADASTLTDAQKLALLSAERGDLQVVGTEIRVRQLEDLDVTVSGQLRARTTSGNVLLGSESNLLVHSVVAPGDVRLKTSANLEGVSGQTNVVSFNAVLEAGQGQLGSAATPMLVDLAPLGTLTARAGGSLFVQELAGDMVVNTVFAKGSATLTSPGAIVEAKPDRLLDVQGSNVRLIAGTTIGRAGGDNALDVGVRATGRLSASAPGGIYLNSTGISGTLGDITTQGEFSLSVADGSINLGGTVQADAGVQLAAADDIRFEGGSVITQGDASLRAGLDGTGSITRADGVGPDVTAQGGLFASAPDAIGGPEPLRLRVGGPVTLQGRLIDATVAPTSTGAPVAVNLSGLGGTTAQDVNLAVTGAGDLRFDTFVVGNANVSTTSSTLGVTAGYVGDSVTFSTPFFTTRIDHENRFPSAATPTVRAFTLTGDFSLDLTPTVATIGAFVISHDLRRQVVGQPQGTAEHTIGQGLRGSRFVPDQDSDGARGILRGSELIDINLNGLDNDL